VRDLSRIQRLYEYQKFLSLAAFRCGQILNRADLARDAGLAYTTAGHFLDLLLATFQVFLVEPYFRNIGKRLIKAPKLMWNDTGLAAHLQGFNRWEDAQRLGRSAFLVENRIAVEMKALLSAYLPLAKLYYWRTSGGAEVDLVVEHDGRLIPIEVKWSEQVSKRDLRGLESFFHDMGSDAPWGAVFYRGTQLLKLNNKVLLVPYHRLWGRLA
jgi:predicted AAA+ superfamily ATPase